MVHWLFKQLMSFNNVCLLLNKIENRVTFYRYCFDMKSKESLGHIASLNTLLFSYFLTLGVQNSHFMENKVSFKM